MTSITENSAREFLAHLEQVATRPEAARDLGAAVILAANEAYRWGRKDVGGFRPADRSGDAAIYESSQLMNARVRSEEGNNSKIKRLSEAVVNLLVGEGIQTFADPFDTSIDLSTLIALDDIEPYLNYALEADDVFTDWFDDPKKFDFSGKRSGQDIQRQLAGECCRVGDSFLLKCNRKRPNNEVSLCYQTIEREQLDTSKDRPEGINQNKIINGIEIDADGQEVAFYVLDAHPYDDFSGQNSPGKSSRISAERMTHLCVFKRPSQNIGVSWLHAIGSDCWDRNKYMTAEMQTAAKGALLLLIHKTQSLDQKATFGLTDGLPSQDYFGNPNMKISSSTMACRVGEKDEVELVESNRPNSGSTPFIDLVDHDMAAGAGIAFSTLSGRYSDLNYSSARAAKLDEDDYFRPLRNWFARQVALPMRKEFHKEAIARGMLNSVSPLQYVRSPKRYMRFDAMAGGRDMLDPLKETEAAAGRCRGGFSTLKIECAKRNLHWMRVLRQMAIEYRLAKSLGVKPDFSKGQGGQVEPEGSPEKQSGKKAA